MDSGPLITGDCDPLLLSDLKEDDIVKTEPLWSDMQLVAPPVGQSFGEVLFVDAPDSLPPIKTEGEELLNLEKVEDAFGDEQEQPTEQDQDQFHSEFNMDSLATTIKTEEMAEALETDMKVAMATLLQPQSSEDPTLGSEFTMNIPTIKHEIENHPGAASHQKTSAKAKKKSTATKAKATKKPKNSFSSSVYLHMACMAVDALSTRNGLSRQAIRKYIMDNFEGVGIGNDEKVFNKRLAMALKIAIDGGYLLRHKGVGATGSFKLGDKYKKYQKHILKTNGVPVAVAYKKKSAKPEKKKAKKKSAKSEKKKAKKKSKPKKQEPELIVKAEIKTEPEQEPELIMKAEIKTEPEQEPEELMKAEKKTGRKQEHVIKIEFEG